MRFCLLFLALLPSSSFAIVGGHEVSYSSPDQYLSVAILAYKIAPAGRFELCSGVLLTPEWVITAAHCFENSAQSVVHFTPHTEYRILDDRRTVDRIILHPGFIPLRNDQPVAGSVDLALLHLAEPAPSAFQIMSLPGAEDIAALNQSRSYTAMGYGAQNEKRRPFGYLVTKEQRLEKAFAATAVEFYTSNRSGETCQGDSGGPAFFKNAAGNFVLFGTNIGGQNKSIFSSRRVCREKSLYLNIFAVSDWIRSQIQ